MSLPFSTLANTIRMLAVDAVQQAKSGHPGMPMGMADIATVLWREFLKHNPNHPEWINRDRFVLSNGHGSMLLYSLLHLCGYDLSLDELKNFRQLHSKTPGHPEYRLTPGVETTTGPLGQGLANAVGMAMSERFLREKFNRPGFNLISHFVYAFCGDGCLMEGISHEACSLAGTLGLGKLIVFWDNNGISIDGPVDGWFTENISLRFSSYGWHVIPDVDGHNPSMIRQAITAAQQNQSQPTLICCKTTIGFGSPNFAGLAKSHGAPLGPDEITLVREQLNWPHAPFQIPAEIYAAWDQREHGSHLQSEWQKISIEYNQNYPELAEELLRTQQKRLPPHWQALNENYLQKCQEQNKPMATRKSSQQYLQHIAPHLPELIGGSADLTESNLTHWRGAEIFSKQHSGNYIYYGVREFAMCAIANGLQLHGGCIPFVATFLTFSDYARNAVRMAALMEIGSIFVFTHDSIGLGEDGPTHQPVEHLNMLRMTPHLSVWRPCDTVESAIAWQMALAQRNKPTCLVFSRQNCPQQSRSADQIAAIHRGGYVLFESQKKPKIILIATGSEVALAMQAAEILQSQQINVRVVSMPSIDHFLKQDPSYQEQVLPKEIENRIAIEAGSTGLWYRFVGTQGRVLGIDQFGVSAPAEDAYRYFNLTVDKIIQTATEMI